MTFLNSQPLQHNFTVAVTGGGTSLSYDMEIIEEHFDENNRYHCEDGPAVILSGGRFSYYKHGYIHRADGPAIFNGFENRWWIEGFDITHDVEKWMIENDITYPFSKDHMILFKLRWI